MTFIICLLLAWCANRSCWTVCSEGSNNKWSWFVTQACILQCFLIEYFKHTQNTKISIRNLLVSIIYFNNGQVLLNPTPNALNSVQFSSVQSLSRIRLLVTPWIAARQASLSITNSWSLPKLMSIELVMPSSHLILCRPLLLLPPIPPRIRVFSNESTLRIRWPKYWSFSFSISPSNEHPGLISFRSLN